YRIELEEIEKVLQTYPGVTAALVLAKPNQQGEKDLIACIVSNVAIDPADIKAFVGKTLPAYMIPAAVIAMTSLPLTPNGKIDRKSLLNSSGLILSGGSEYVGARDETETQLVEIWEELLGRSGVGVKDHFFELGGHSLKATRLVSRIHKVFQVKVALKELFLHPVLEEQARMIRQAGRTAFRPIGILGEQRDYALSSSQRRLWVLSQFGEANVAYNMPGVYVFEGVLDRRALDEAFGQLVRRHESLRTIFKED